MELNPGPPEAQWPDKPRPTLCYSICKIKRCNFFAPHCTVNCCCWCYVFVHSLFFYLFTGSDFLETCGWFSENVVWGVGRGMMGWWSGQRKKCYSDSNSCSFVSGTVYRPILDYVGCHTASSDGYWRHFYSDSEATAQCELFLTAPNRNILTFLLTYTLKSATLLDKTTCCNLSMMNCWEERIDENCLLVVMMQ